MRRIIERVVTVVTTTTWKISWEADPPSAGPTADPGTHEVPKLEGSPEIMTPGRTVIETKEVDPPELKNAPDNG
jgi:hypothetical protein